MHDSVLKCIELNLLIPVGSLGGKHAYGCAPQSMSLQHQDNDVTNTGKVRVGWFLCVTRRLLRVLCPGSLSDVIMQPANTSPI